jgi:hypothetical protein
MVRVRAASVWTGSELFYWGGDTGFGGTHHGDGAMYDPVKGRLEGAASWASLRALLPGGSVDRV